MDDVFNASDSDTLVQSTSQESPLARSSVDSGAIESDTGDKKPVNINQNQAINYLTFIFSDKNFF